MTPISEQAPQNAGERLRKSVEVLTLIENCRRVTGDSELGLAIERLIVQREVSELEETVGQDETAPVTKLDRELVIPVRRVVDPWVT